MNHPIHNFSGKAHADTYRRFRPTYPQALYDVLLAAVPERNRCWDCATGNGQVALALADAFREVIATDISTAQLAAAPGHPNVVYQELRAEHTPFPDGHFDLITVGQAFHWFDQAAFNREAHRVLVPEGVVAVWCYSRLKTQPSVEAIIEEIFDETLDGYWDPQRHYPDTGYVGIQFDFTELPIPEELSIKVSWSLEQLVGYLNSWSAVHKFIAARGFNPIEQMVPKLRAAWGEVEVRDMQFPLHLRLGKK